MDSNKSANLIFAAIFLVVCSLPLVGLVVPGLDPSVALNEKRELAAAPNLVGESPASVPGELEAWFDDHFGFRGLLVRLHGLFHYRVFNVSGSKLVLAGRDRWLFYDGRGARGGDPRRNHLARLPKDYQAMFRALREQLEYNDHYFAKQGITYLVVVVPDKWSVYSEMLPASVGVAPDQTCGDLFVEYLQAESDLKVLDLKQALRARRRTEGPIYHQIDSHWNELGAYLAAGEISSFVQRYDSRVAPLQPTVPRVTWQRRRHGDLAALMGLDGWLAERAPVVVDSAYPDLSVVELPRPANSPRVSRLPMQATAPDVAGPRLLVMRDSYGDALLPWLSRSFSVARWVWTSNVRMRNLQPVVDEARPDIVIEEKAEKYLMYPGRYFVAPGRLAVPPRSTGQKRRR